MDFFANIDKMEKLRLKPGKSAEEIVENWDDDDFMIGDDEDLTFRSHSTITASAHNISNNRRRNSRRSSLPSDQDVPQSEERQVHLPGDDKKSTLDAIAAATLAGIPIPTNVPPSALMGGTIKRLGGRKIKNIFQEDWDDELELPGLGQALRLKTHDGNTFPEALRQVSGSTNPSPAKKSLFTLAHISPPISPPRLGRPITLGAPINLEKFRDADDDDFSDGLATIKASKLQIRGRPISLVAPPTPSPSKKQRKNFEEEDFENDLELPFDGKLKLSSRRDIPKTPSLHTNDDFDWVEGSLGTRFGGTRRGAFSNRSSSVSAMSPSLASSFTAESEDEFFDGLVIPNGPLDLSERLKRQKQSRSPEPSDANISHKNKQPCSSKAASPPPLPKRAALVVTPPKRGTVTTPSPKRVAVTLPSPKRGAATSPAPKRATPVLPSPKRGSPTPPSPKRASPTLSGPKGGSPTPPAPKRASPTSPSPKRASPTLSSKGESPSTPAPKRAAPAVPSPKRGSPTALSPNRASPALSGPKRGSPTPPTPKRTSPTLPSPKRGSPVLSSSKRAVPSPKSPTGGLTNRTGVNKDEDDLVSGLDLGEGNVFRYAKPTVHRNVKVKEARQTSPTRPKAAVSITFTNKPVNPINSRIPRPMVNHERSHTQSSLEPVYENGGPVPQKPCRRPPSRLSGHSTHSSISSVHTPTTPSAARPNLPSPPRRGQSGQKAPLGVLRTEPSTTNAHLLRLKRSLPAIRHAQSPAKPATRSDRPTSGGDSRMDSHRPQSSVRPKTPIERTRPAYESSAAQARKGQAPFLPAGVSQSQSHNVNAKGSRLFRRHDSDQGPEVKQYSGALSRNAIRSPSPSRSKNEKSTPEPAWQQVNKPRRARHFGNGHELDAFDDLPTSSQTESRYVKQPNASGNKTSFRNKMYQNVLPDRNNPSPVSPYSPSGVGPQPHFARDTAASRLAREAGLAQRTQPASFLAGLASQRSQPASSLANLVSQRTQPISSLASLVSQRTQPISSLASLVSQRTQPASSLATLTSQRALPTSSLATLTSQRAGNLSSRGNINLHAPLHHNRSKKSRKQPQLKPHLISNLNSAKDSKVVNGMTYNPATFRWEGNENVLNAFEPPAPQPPTEALPQPTVRDRDAVTPRPVLITNINTKKEMKRVGDMVFDPQNMCWLKIETPTPNCSQLDNTIRGFAPLQEEDPFKDIPDLEDKVSSTNGPGRASDIRDDWMVGEEFDVGPEFVRRQREEEARWRRKCEKWTGKVSRDRTDWRWAIRDLVMQSP